MKLNFDISEEMLQKLDSLANSKLMTRAEYLRSIIRNEIFGTSTRGTIEVSSKPVIKSDKIIKTKEDVIKAIKSPKGSTAPCRHGLMYCRECM